MRTIKEGGYAIKRRFLSTFISDVDIVSLLLSEPIQDDNKREVFERTNRLIWEFIDVSGWSRCEYDKAVAYLTAKKEPLLVLTDAVDSKRVTGEAPAYTIQPNQVQQILMTIGFWNFYVFDASFSWCIAFTDECEVHCPNGVCFSNIQEL